MGGGGEGCRPVIPVTQHTHCSPDPMALCTPTPPAAAAPRFPVIFTVEAMDNTESEVQASAFELDEMSELGAVDMFLSPSFEPESMAATSAVDDSANSETRHAEGLVETVMTGTDDAPDSAAATGVDNGSKKKKTRKNWPKPKSGDRLLYVMMDVEFSHPMKALGEIFEIGARPFRVDVVDGKSTTSIDLSAGVMMYKEQIEPSLEYGAAEFYFMTIEVRLQRCVALFFVIASPPPIVFLNLLSFSPSKVVDLLSPSNTI